MSMDIQQAFNQLNKRFDRLESKIDTFVSKEEVNRSFDQLFEHLHDKVTEKSLETRLTPIEKEQDRLRGHFQWLTYTVIGIVITGIVGSLFVI